MVKISITELITYAILVFTSIKNQQLFQHILYHKLNALPVQTKEKFIKKGNVIPAVILITKCFL